MCRLDKKERTHEDKSGIQIFIVLFVEVVVVLSDFLFELVVETGPGIAATIFLQDRLQGVT